ncbi:unnamed protein product [Ilex paraguariensis]|uniref:1-acylglycerol-3-phosphate O-acyltransferase n=1 Tax=Ilex paraguariensis TaxID=185542 RepID=A0ABC8R7I2_9AQUA
MEVRVPLVSSDGPRHHTLTPLRALRGVICMLVLLLTAFITLVYIVFLTAVILRIFSLHYSRKTTSFFFGSWLALLPFLLEKINKTKVVFSGDCVPVKERVLVIANHRVKVDWIYLWDFALRKGYLGYMKYIVKSIAMKLPVIGWGFHVLEFIAVGGNWEFDEPTICKMLSTFRDPQDPLWLAVFPEGTDFSEPKCIESQNYAAQNGLPILSNVLLPRTKGFCACLEELRGSLDAGCYGFKFASIDPCAEEVIPHLFDNLLPAVYDLTIGYKHRCPSFLDNVFGVDPSEVHIHVRRIPLTDIPASEDQAVSWLIDTFCLKDLLLSDFYSQGHFPREGIEGDLSTVKCLVNFIFIIILTSICTLFTYFSSLWFKLYISLVCAYLVCATYLDFRPLPIMAL